MLGGSKINQYEKISYFKCNCNDYACLYIYQPAA